MPETESVSNRQEVRITFGGLQIVGEVSRGLGLEQGLWALHPDLEQTGSGTHDHGAHAGHAHAHRAVLWISNGVARAGTIVVPVEPENPLDPIVPIECYSLTGGILRIALDEIPNPRKLDDIRLLHILGGTNKYAVEATHLRSPLRRRWPGALLSVVHVTGGELEKGIRKFKHPAQPTALDTVDHFGAFVWRGTAPTTGLVLTGLLGKPRPVTVTPADPSKPLELGVMFLPEGEFPQQGTIPADPGAHLKQLKKYLEYWLAESDAVLASLDELSPEGLKNFCPVSRLF